MAKFVSLLNWTDQGARGATSTVERAESAKALAAQMGGSLEVYWDMPALALTDHGTMFGVIDFYNAATAEGIQPIIGVEAYLAPRTMKDRDPQADKKSAHLLLLAENETGYKHLLQICSAAQLEGFYYYPRIDHDLLAGPVAVASPPMRPVLVAKQCVPRLGIRRGSGQ